MSTIEFKTSAQFMRDVRKWMKKNNISLRKFAKLTGTALSTLQRVTEKPEVMQVKTVTAYMKAINTYKPSVASRSKENPVSPASRRG